MLEVGDKDVEVLRGCWSVSPPRLYRGYTESHLGSSHDLGQRLQIAVLGNVKDDLLADSVFLEGHDVRRPNEY